MYMQGNREEELKDHLIVNSGCSRSMTGEKELLSDFKAYFGGKVAFGNDLDGGRITGKGTIKNVLYFFLILSLKIETW